MRAKEFVTEKWSAKYKRSIDCKRPKGFSQRAHCQGKKKNESVTEADLVVRGFSGPTPKEGDWVVGKIGTTVEGQLGQIQKINPTRNVYRMGAEAEVWWKSRAQTDWTPLKWLKKIGGSKFSEDTSETLDENLRDWFGKGKEGGAGGGGWDRYNTKGERIGKCGDRKPGEGKPKCLSKSRAASLRASGGKKAIANAVKRKKAQDKNPERRGKAKNVKNVAESVIYSDRTPNKSGLSYREINRVCGVPMNYSQFAEKIVENFNIRSDTNLLEIYGYYLRKLNQSKNNIRENKTDRDSDNNISKIEQNLFKIFKERSQDSISDARVGDSVSLLHLATINIPGHKIEAKLSGFLNPKKIVAIKNLGRFKQLEFQDGSKYPENSQDDLFQTVQSWNMTKLFRDSESASRSYMFYALIGNKLSDEMNFVITVDSTIAEETMKQASENPPGPKFGGYYGATQRGAPKPGQGFGASESIGHKLKHGFDVRSDVLWPVKMFEEHDKNSTKFINWIENYREQVDRPKENTKCILAMINRMLDQIMIIYGTAIYVDQDKDSYLLKIDSGTHRYDKKNQIVFRSKIDFDKFLTELSLKFVDDSTRLKIKQDTVIETVEKISEVAPPDQENWIKKNKERFIKQYGKELGTRVLYATAWKRSKADEAANWGQHEGHVSKNPVGIPETKKSKDIKISSKTEPLDRKIK